MHGEDKQFGGEIVIQNRFFKWLDNFWYHYKWTVIVVTFFLFVGIVCLAQCSSRETTDLTVTYAGGFLFDEEERDALANALQSVSPAKKQGEGNMSVAINPYSIFTEEELKALFTNEKGEFNVYGYNTAKAQTQDQFSTLGNFVKTGETAVFFVSPMVYEELNLQKLAQPLSNLYETIPANAYDTHAVYLKDTAFYQYFEAIQFLPEDTLIVILQPLVFGASSNSETYASFLEFYQNIVNFQAP